MGFHEKQIVTIAEMKSQFFTLGHWAVWAGQYSGGNKAGVYHTQAQSRTGMRPTAADTAVFVFVAFQTGNTENQALLHALPEQLNCPIL